MTDTAVETAPPRVTPRRRKISWDVVRAACIVLVLIYHATFIGPALHPEFAQRGFVFSHQMGASLLLLVSAYFACVTLGRYTALRYWWGRIARLLPAYIVAVAALFVIMRLFSPAGWYLPGKRDFVANELMLWNWKGQLFPFLDGSYWTIPLQLMAFTAAALLYRSSWGHGRKLRVVLWALVIIPLLQWPLRISGPPEAYRMLVDGFGFHRLHMFVAGIAIWMWSTKRLSNAHAFSLLGLCLFAHLLHTSAFAPDGSLHFEWGSWSGMAIGFVVILVAASGADWDRLVPDRVRRAIQWFAGISYGVYLTHQTLGYLVMRWLQDLGAGWEMQVLAMLVTGTLAGWALTKMVERPMQTRLMEWYDSGAEVLRRRLGPPTLEA